MTDGVDGGDGGDVQACEVQLDIERQLIDRLTTFYLNFLQDG